MNCVDPINSLFRIYVDNQSVMAKVNYSHSVVSSNVADLRDFEDGSPNCSPRSTNCSTCNTRISNSHLCTTVITIPRSSFKNNATVTVTKSLGITPANSEHAKRLEPNNGLLRRQFETQNARVRDLTEQLRQTEQKLKRETVDLKQKFQQAVDSLRAAGDREGATLKRLARCECQLSEAEASVKIFSEKHATLERELLQSHSKLQQMRSEIDRLQEENRELVFKENEIKTHSSSALEELAEWKKKCSSVEQQLVELCRTARNDVFHLTSALEASAEECRQKIEQSKATNASDLKEAKAKNQELHRRLEEVTKQSMQMQENLVRSEEARKETLRRVKQEMESAKQRAENLQAALAARTADHKREQERLQLQVSRYECENAELKEKVRQAELIREQRFDAACRERDQIKGENSRLKLKLEEATRKVEAAVCRERANKFSVETMLAKADADYEELKQQLASVEEQHRSQVDGLQRTNTSLVGKICEIKQHFAELERSDSVVMVKKSKRHFHLEQTYDKHDYHDSAFCAYKN